MPNKQMVDSIVDNWSMRTHRRAEIKLELSVKTPVSKIENVIAEIKTILDKKTAQLSPYSVFLKDISKTGITVVIEYFTSPIPMDEFDTIKQQINLQVKTLLEENEIGFAGEANTLVITNDSKQG